MNAWMQTGAGRPLDLLSLDLARIDIAAEIAWPLAGLARFNGHQATNRRGSRDPIYSVAQHCVVGADAVLAETGDPAAALAFVVHDVHENLFGDLTTPAEQALEAHVETALAHVFGLDAATLVRAAFGAGLVKTAVAGLKAGIDARVHRLAGLPSILPPEMAGIVRDMDLRMLDLERRQILGPTLHPPGEAIWPKAVLAARPVRLRGRLRPWQRHKAAEEWMSRFEKWRIPSPQAPRHPVSVDSLAAAGC